VLFVEVKMDGIIWGEITTVTVTTYVMAF